MVVGGGADDMVPDIFVIGNDDGVFGADGGEGRAVIKVSSPHDSAEVERIGPAANGNYGV